MAEIMGPGKKLKATQDMVAGLTRITECTPKAITHRIGIIRNKVNTATQTKPGKAPSTPRKPAPRTTAPATPKSNKVTKKPAGGKRKRSENNNEDDASTGGEDEEENVVKSYSDLESGDDAGQAKDRSALRRSDSARPGQYAGMDDSEESDVETPSARPAKKVKVEGEF